MANLDKLLIEEYGEPVVLTFLKENQDRLNYISHAILNHEANLYIPDDVSGMEEDEVEQLRNFCKSQLETLLANLQKLVVKLFEKKGSGIYVSFYDEILYKTKPVYEKITVESFTVNPTMNRVFITSAYILRLLLSHYFNTIDFQKKVISYMKQKLEEQKDNIFLCSILQQRLDKCRTDLHIILETTSRNIERYAPFITCFIDNIVSCIVRNSEQDNEYLSKYPDQVIGIIQSICKLPQPEYVKYIINQSIHKLYLCRIIPNPIRFDIFSCIANSNSNIKSLLDEIIYIEMPGVLMDDAHEFGKLCSANPKDFSFHFVSSMFLLNFYIKRMEHNGTNAHLIYYISANLEKTRSLIVQLFEFINARISEIYKSDSEHNQELIDGLIRQIHLFLKMIKQFIRMYPDIINCHLVHYIPYVVINIWNNYSTTVDDEIVHLLAEILIDCSVNNDFINYFTSLISDNISKYERLIYFDKSKLQQRFALFNKLSSIDSEFVDPIQNIFILKVAFLPIPGTNPMICDKYVIQSVLRTNPENPFTRKKLSIDDFNKIQIELKDVIDTKELERKKFVSDNKLQ
jgi:hypothetical protein